MIYVLIPTTKERRERLQKCIDAVRNSVIDHPITICVYENTDGGCVKAEHKMLEGITGLAFILNDDMVVEPDCIQTLLDHYEDGLLLQPFEDIHKGDLAVSPFAHTDFLKKYIYPGYVHNYNDTELTEVAQMLGKYKKIEKAVIHHEHFTRGAKKDQTYEATQSHFAKDRDLFISRKKNNFFLDIKSL